MKMYRTDERSGRLLMLVTLLLIFSFCYGCQQQGSELKAPPLSLEEGMEDLETIITQMKRHYGPLEYKEKRFAFSFDAKANEAREAMKLAESEFDKFAVMKVFLGEFEDGHVSLSFPGNAKEFSAYDAGVFLAPYKGDDGKYKALVAYADDYANGVGVSIGDEVLSIDGKSPWDIHDIIKKYDWWGNEVTDRHSIYNTLHRPVFIPEILPSGPTTVVKLKSAQGSEYTVDLPWNRKVISVGKIQPLLKPVDANMTVGNAGYYNASVQGNVLGMGEKLPFFMSPRVGNEYRPIIVTPSAFALGAEGISIDDVSVEAVDGSKEFAIYGAMYRYQGKSILLVRQATYSPEIEADHMIAAYRALLKEYEAQVDVLVVDQTHNPGGSLAYAEDFFRLFIPMGQQAGNLVQAHNADRRWIYDFGNWAEHLREVEKDNVGAQLAELSARIVDDAMNEGKAMTAPLPFIGPKRITASHYSWSKPILVLADELAGSCGDIFPMLMKRNGIAKIFGQRTMGLGGNVEEVAKLPNTQAALNITRGLFTIFKEGENYTDADMVENNGITPDILRELTVNDFREGYVSYVADFSSAAVALVSGEDVGEDMEGTAE